MRKLPDTGFTLKSLSYKLFPATCHLCMMNSQRSFDLCECCEAALPLVALSCIHCALPLPEVLQTIPQIDIQPICTTCLHAPPSFKRAIAGFLYASHIINMLHRIKFQQGTLDSYLLSHLFVRQLELAYTTQRLPEIILPVPLAPARLFRRGYNQSAGIARQLGQELNIPVNYHLLSRKLNTRPQTGLNRTARAKNLHNAFQVDKPIKYTCVALVDDVMTTGATLQSLAQCLLSAGVEEVHVWVLARTPQ